MSMPPPAAVSPAPVPASATAAAPQPLPQQLAPPQQQQLPPPHQLPQPPPQQAPPPSTQQQVQATQLQQYAQHAAGHRRPAQRAAAAPRERDRSLERASAPARGAQVCKTHFSRANSSLKKPSLLARIGMLPLHRHLPVGCGCRRM